jgi:hypothetical protein
MTDNFSIEMSSDRREGGADIRSFAKASGSLFYKRVIAALSVVIVVLIIVLAVGWSKYNDRETFDNPTGPASGAAIVNFGASYTIGAPPVLPSDGNYIEFTLLHLNDVYELLPLNNGTLGGIARVATIKDMLKAENPNTWSLLAGDLISPSAVGTVTYNGSTLSGRQMVDTMNTMGLDFATFGNHGKFYTLQSHHQLIFAQNSLTLLVLLYLGSMIQSLITLRQ